MVARLKKLILVILILSIVGCQPELPSLLATQRTQLTDYPVVTGKLTEDATGTYLLLADNRLQHWQNTSGKMVKEWQNLDADSLHLAISSDGEYILTANQKSLSLWQSDSDTPIGTLDLSQQLLDANITAINFWQAPMQFIIGTSGGTVIVADVRNQTYRAMQHHDGEITKIVKLITSEHLLTGGNDGLVTLWDMRNYEVLNTVSTPFRITSLAVSSETSATFISDALDKQYIWQPIQNKITYELEYWQQYQWFRLADFIEQDTLLVTSSPKTDITLWDLQQQTAIATWAAESHSLGSTVMDMTYVNQEYLITLSSDAVLQEWPVKALLNKLAEK